MAYTYEQVMELLGDEAQAVPGAIVVHRGKHIDVAYTNVGGGFVVTAEGAEILGDIIAAEKAKKAEAKAKKADGKGAKKEEEVVESANTSAGDGTDLNLSE